MHRIPGIAFPFLLLWCPLGAQNTPNADLFGASREARANGEYHMLLRQFRADEPKLAPRHEAGPKPAAASYQTARDVPAGHWVWVAPYWFVFRDGPTEQVESRSWGPEQACGEPDTAAPGDHVTAWASMAEDAAGEWLLLEYEHAVRATSLEVHENFNPGAICAVAILTHTGEELELWRNDEAKATAEPARVLRIDLPVGFSVERVKLYLQSEAVPGWNEIDAVGVRDDRGKVHWAQRTSASSSYADKRAIVAPLVVLPPAQVQDAEQQEQEGAALLGVKVRGPLPPVAPVTYVAQLPAPMSAVEALAAAEARNAILQRRIDELEARVKALEQELRKARAVK